MTTREHLLVILMEECAEVIHRASKLLRFGPADRDPADGKPSTDGLVDELNDLAATINMLEIHDVIPATWESSAAGYLKREKVKKFLEYSKTMGTLQD